MSFVTSRLSLCCSANLFGHRPPPNTAQTKSTTERLVYPPARTATQLSRVHLLQQVSAIVKEWINFWAGINLQRRPTCQVILLVICKNIFELSRQCCLVIGLIPTTSVEKDARTFVKVTFIESVKWGWQQSQKTWRGRWEGMQVKTALLRPLTTSQM